MNRLLTVKECESFAPQAKVYHKKASPLDGHWLRIAISGRRTWLLSYTAHSGQSRTLTIGPYPQVSPSESFQAAKIALGQVSAGLDPQQMKTEKRSQLKQDSVDSVSAVIDAHIEAVKLKGKKSWGQKKAILDRLVKPRLGDRAVRSLTRKDIVWLVDDINAAHGSNIARASHAHFSAVLRWADGKDLIDVFPARNIELPGVIAHRDRVLSDQELSVIWEATDRMVYPGGPLVKMLLMTALRRTEAAHLSRSEIDLPGRLITIPASRMKAGREHVLPITDTMMKVLLDLPVHGQFLFSFDSGQTPLIAYSRVKSQLDKAIAEVCKERGIEPFEHVFHDYRRACRSKLADLGVDRTAAEQVLAHTVQGVEAVYNKSAHIQAKRQALEAWQSHLLGLTKSPQVKVTA